MVMGTFSHYLQICEGIFFRFQVELCDKLCIPSGKYEGVQKRALENSSGAKTLIYLPFQFSRENLTP